MASSAAANSSPPGRGLRASPLATGLIAALLLLGCAEKERVQPQRFSSDELIRCYSEQFVAGVDEGSVHIRAGRIDPESGDLLDVHIETRDGFIAAARARFTVRASDDTFSLTLLDVRIARSGASPSPLIRVDLLTTQPIDLGVDVHETIRALGDGVSRASE